MPFTAGQYLTKNDLDSQELAHTLGYGVLNGLKVVSDAPPMDIEVEIGKAYVANTLVENGAVTPLTVTGADPTNPRKDIVVCNSAGTLSIVAGTPEAALPIGNIGIYTLNPEPDNIPANSIILAEIWVPAGATEITGSEIYDKRVSIADFIGHKGDASAHHEKYTDAEVNAIIAAKIKAGSVTDTTGADGKISVSFAEAFASTPMVTVQLENDVDYYPVVIAKSTTGFTVKILKTAHTHTNPNTSADGAGTPAGTVGAEAAHTHGISFTSGAGSSHRHSVGITSGSGGSHSHTQGATGGPSATQGILTITGTPPSKYCATTSGGECTYSFYAIGLANLAVSNMPTSTHTHTNPSTSTKAAHTHSVSGNSGYESSHTHAVSGSSGVGSSHNHSFTGSALGTHSHTQGATGSSNAGNALVSTSVTFSYIAVAL